MGNGIIDIYNNGNGKVMIFVVDDMESELEMCKRILGKYFTVIACPTVVKMFEQLQKHTPDLVILDILMPEIDGYEAAMILKNNDKHRDIPVIFVTSMNDKESEMKAFKLGAVDYIHKPYDSDLLFRRVEAQLKISRQKREMKKITMSVQNLLSAKSSEFWQLQQAVLNIIADLVECRDETTGRHIERTQEYLKIMISRMADMGIYGSDVENWDLSFLLPSAQLHDIGKIGITDAILNKPDKLTEAEFEIVKRHVNIGLNAIEHMEAFVDDNTFFRYAKLFVGYHHERWDGKGYPHGAKGTDIPLEGRLMAIVDVYDALTNVRPYKPSYSHKKSVLIIEEESGTQFDPELIKIFSSVESDFEQIRDCTFPIAKETP